jgi:hypothetical protein
MWGQIGDAMLGDTDNPIGAINDAFGLTQSELVFLDINANPGEGFTTVIPIDGAPSLVDFWPHSVRADDFRVVVQTGADQSQDWVPTAPRTLRGEVVGVPFTSVAGSLFDHGLAARIVLPDGGQRWIEPVATHFGDAPDDLYVIYRPEWIIDQGYQCGVGIDGGAGLGGNIGGDFLVPPGGGAGNDGDGNGDGNGDGGDDLGDIIINGDGGEPDDEFCKARLALDADLTFFERWFSSVPLTVDRMEAIINLANVQYEVQTGITHELGLILVRVTDEADPYTDTTDPGALIAEVVVEWETNQTAFDAHVHGPQPRRRRHRNRRRHRRRVRRDAVLAGPEPRWQHHRLARRPFGA